MKYSSIPTLLLMTLASLHVCQCFTNQTELSIEARNAQAAKNIVGNLKNAWTWIKQQAGSEDTFVGRCAGAFKKMRMALSFIIFKLGVIVTALAFLSVLAFKTLGVGVIILIISSIGLSSKFFASKHGGGGHESSQGSAIHVHLHNKDGHGGGGGGGGGGHYHEHYPEWYDRLDRVVPKNQLERMAIADLYKRLKLTEDLYGTTSLETDTYS